MKYKMYKYDRQKGVWCIHAEFDNEEALLWFLSIGTNTYNGLPRQRWTNNYIAEQNLTGKDIITSSRWVAVRDENGDIKRNQWGPVYELEHYRNIREWHLEDEYGRTVDMTIFKDKIFEMVDNISVSMRNTMFMRTCKSNERRSRQGRAYHHALHFRCGPKSHRYGRTLKTFESFDEDVEIRLSSHQANCLRVKPKDMYAKYKCGADFWRRCPTGWKEHKNSKQWEAKQKRIAKRLPGAVWLSHENKRIELEAFDDVV